MDKKNYYLFGFCVLFLIIKLISITTTNFNLYGDEAQYWIWSKNLAFGYYSKPPLLAWIIRAYNAFGGDSFVILKLIPISLYCLTSYLIFILTNKLWDNSFLSFLTAMTFFLLPSVSLSSFLITTDVVLVLFWVAGLIMVLKIREESSLKNFILLGLVVGFCFLAKYAAIYFIVSLIILIVVEKEFKKSLLKSKINILISFLIFLIIISPNIIWNFQNNWVTLSHTADNASLENININIRNFFEFILVQVVMVGPILFIAFLFYFLKNIKISTNEKFLVCFFLPTFLFILIESLFVRAHANWAAVSLVSLVVLLVKIVYKFNKKIIYLNNYFNLIIGLVLFMMIGTTYHLGFFDRIRGFDNLISFVNETNKNHINNFVLNDRLLFANLNYAYRSKNKKFYSTHKPKTKINHHFQINNALPINFSENFIFIGYEDEIDYWINEKEINYLKNKKIIRQLGSKTFPFTKQYLEIYEVIFE